MTSYHPVPSVYHPFDRDKANRRRKRPWLLKGADARHEKFYWDQVKQKQKKRRDLTKDEKIAHLRALGKAREPFEDRLLAKLEKTGKGSK
jgi:hypothetical protein